MALAAQSRAMASSFTRFLDHTQRRTAVGRTPLDEWSDRRRDLYLTTLTTDIHVPGGIRTHNLSRRTAADLRLRRRGHWDRQPYIGPGEISSRSHSILMFYSIEVTGKKTHTLRSRHSFDCRIALPKRASDYWATGRETSVVTCQTVIEKLDINRSWNESGRCAGIWLGTFSVPWSDR